MGVGFKLDSNGNFFLENKKLVNVDEGTENQDVINKHQLDTGLNTKGLNTKVTQKWPNIEPEAGKLIKYLSDKGILTKKNFIYQTNSVMML